MPADVTLSPGDRNVFDRVPVVWTDENVAGATIAQTLNKRSGDTLRRLSRLVTMGLVQRRHSERGPFTSEVRRLTAVTP